MVFKIYLNEVFHEKLGEKAYIKTLGSDRAYLLGMAYLLGYRMERDTEHAIKLLKESAEAQGKFALDASE